MLTSFQTPNLAQPNEGSRAISNLLDFSGASVVFGDLTNEAMDGRISFIQSIFIDNADNAANLDLTLFGAPIPQRIRAQPYTQGWYPVSWPVGALRYSSVSAQGQKINVIFANYAMPYSTWGAVPGVLVVPNLSNIALNAVALGVGNTQLVPGIAGETIRMFRGIFEVDQPAILKFTDGPGGTVLFTSLLTAGGSATFQASGIPWFNSTSPGNDLTVNSNAACNLYGGFGYVQN